MFLYDFFNATFLMSLLFSLIITVIITGIPLYFMAKRANLKYPVFAFIPILNVITVSHLAGISAWKYFLFIALSFIPFVGFIISIVFSIYMAIKVSKNFGLETLGIILYALFPFIAQIYIVLTNKEFVGIIPDEYKADNR